MWAGLGRFTDPLVLTSQVASVKFTSHSFHAPLPNTVFSSLLYPTILPETYGG